MGVQTVRFPNGRKISEKTTQCLRLMAKSGFVTRKIWCDFFAQGNPRWQRRQIQRLCEKRLIEPHSNSKAKDVFVLASYGKILLAREGLPFVHPPFVDQMEHDELVMRSVLELSQSRLIRGFLFENEMKSSQMKQHRLPQGVGQDDQHFSDALFELNILGKNRIVAFEYERSGKSPQRYRDKLWAYSHTNSHWVVIFVCESDAIKSMIKRQLDYLRSPTLTSKVAFVDKSEWIKDPTTAEVVLENQSFSIRSLVTPKSYEKDREVAHQLAR